MVVSQIKARQQGVRFSALCALVCAGLLAAAVHAGEPVPPPPAPAPQAEPEKKPQPVEEAFRFDKGERRDPFTFAKGAAIRPGPGPDPEPGPPPINPAEIQAKKAEAEQHYAAAEEDMLDSKSVEAVQKCDKGLEVFKDIPNIATYKELQDIRERLFRLRKAAERIRTRQEAERDFGALAIRVTGVVARERNSHAIVNAKVVSKGELVPTTQDGPDIVVDEILPQQVVFLFRGFRMMLTVSESSR